MFRHSRDAKYLTYTYSWDFCHTLRNPPDDQSSPIIGEILRDQAKAGAKHKPWLGANEAIKQRTDSVLTASRKDYSCSHAQHQVYVMLCRRACVHDVLGHRVLEGTVAAPPKAAVREVAGVSAAQRAVVSVVPSKRTRYRMVPSCSTCAQPPSLGAPHAGRIICSMRSDMDMPPLPVLDSS